MNGSLRIGRVFGIDVRVHYLWLLMVGILGLFSPKLLIILPVLFGVVLLHELGHALMAKHFRVRVLDITLWPLGGMARMASIPEDTKVETLIALAGPAVNFALAALTIPWMLTGVFLDAAFWFFMTNMVLGTFNLIPAFPMDGGRVLRALLAWRGDWLGATEKAVRIGRIFAVVIILSAFFLPVTPMVMLIGLWLLMVGSQELQAVRMRHARAAFGARGFGPGAFGPGGFGPGGFGQGPSDEPAAAPPPPPRAPREKPVGHARRPEASPGSATHHGWSEEEVRRLEGFSGPLSQYRPRRSE